MFIFFFFNSMTGFLTKYLTSIYRVIILIAYVNWLAIQTRFFFKVIFIDAHKIIFIIFLTAK